MISIELENSGSKELAAQGCAGRLCRMKFQCGVRAML